MSAGPVGIIAGGGALPVRLAEQCARTGRTYFVARIEGLADPALADHPGASFPLGAMGARFAALKAAGCTAVVMAGLVKRPDFAALKLDARGAAMLPRLMAAAVKGDDALLRVLAEECEREGLQVLGAEAVFDDLLAPQGVFGACAPSHENMQDIAKGMMIAGALGGFDIAQGVVVCRGLVLAVEAAEGTDAMLARLCALPETIRGRPGAPAGVLVKRAKPGQDRRLDLPVIGAATLTGAKAAHLAGIAVEAGGALVIDRAALTGAADAAGLFLFGAPP
jgi:DUF1009 family protein